MHASGHTGTIRSSVTTNVNVILVSLSYRYRVQCDWGLYSATTSQPADKMPGQWK